MPHYLILQGPLRNEHDLKKLSEKKLSENTNSL